MNIFINEKAKDYVINRGFAAIVVDAQLTNIC